MFDVAPTELLLVVVVALVVIGPKDLPKAMRFVGKWMGKARGMARHFRAGLDTMMREAELEEMEKKWRADNERIMREHPLLPPTATMTATTPAPAAESEWGKAPDEVEAPPEAQRPRPKAPPRPAGAAAPVRKAPPAPNAGEAP